MKGTEKKYVRTKQRIYNLFQNLVWFYCYCCEWFFVLWFSLARAREPRRFYCRPFEQDHSIQIHKKKHIIIKDLLLFFLHILLFYDLPVWFLPFPSAFSFSQSGDKNSWNQFECTYKNKKRKKREKQVTVTPSIQKLCSAGYRNSEMHVTHRARRARAFDCSHKQTRKNVPLIKCWYAAAGVSFSLVFFRPILFFFPFDTHSIWAFTRHYMDEQWVFFSVHWIRSRFCDFAIFEFVFMCVAGSFLLIWTPSSTPL